jgi:hypothetical protein
MSIQTVRRVISFVERLIACARDDRFLSSSITTLLYDVFKFLTFGIFRFHSWLRSGTQVPAMRACLDSQWILEYSSTEYSGYLRTVPRLRAPNKSKSIKYYWYWYVSTVVPIPSDQRTSAWYELYVEATRRSLGSNKKTAACRVRYADIVPLYEYLVRVHVSVSSKSIMVEHRRSTKIPQIT